MGRIEVDKVEDKVIAGIAVEAKLQGRTFDDQVRSILGAHALISKEDRLKIVDEIRAMTPKDRPQSDSAEMLRALRDGNFDHN